MPVTDELKDAMAKMKEVIYGQDEVVDLLFAALLSEGHVLLESVPGSGKTKLAKSFAKVIEGDFSRIQLTPDVLPSDVTGIQFFNPATREFELKIGPVQTNILLADEINRASPRTQSSLLEVMGEQQITIEGETIDIDSPFLVIATQNPVESNQGTFPLPEAQLDRFMMKIPMDYPSYEFEKVILTEHQSKDPFDGLTSVLTQSDIRQLQAQTSDVTISDGVLDYLLNIVRATRSHQAIELGASSRAALALMRAARSHAFIQERDYVTPEDIKRLIPYVLKHRLILSMEESLRRGVSDVLNDIMDSVDVPVERSQAN